ncbi:PHP domain-containing protein [Clostridium cadaveris]|mgnify:FL=1|uniref:PHP domain-containing protein n=1 Tax=Clostridium cadaveris TaxID=1529 RepID=UPI000414E85A|nr:PHP domain-containing protein [Clostridium cadaveris]NWK09778.1 PHP domain-containing protein [Clostridium cadaveris]
MFKKGDFHIHSIYSDGSMTPSKIVRMAKFYGVDIMSISDHNIVLGIDEAIKEGECIGVEVIPAVEISARYKNIKVHVLGYFKDDSYKNDMFNEILMEAKRGHIEKIRYMFGNTIDFYEYSHKLYIETAVRILKFFGATVVLAHPVLLPREEFEIIKTMGFDGIEAKYAKNTIDDTRYFIHAAKSNNMIYTAGSDFHRINDVSRNHGNIGEVYLNEEEIDDFLTRSGLISRIKKL